MTNKSAESSQTQEQQQQNGDFCSLAPALPSEPPDEQSHGGNKVFKSGSLFISSKGIGWTSWKKRWFILTRTSLIFFRSDPNAIPQRSGEVNLTLGGIDLNNLGSVVVKADKKLLTVLFPDGRDGRAFTLKAETSEDLNEWKNALETALAQAPNASDVMGQNGILRNDNNESANDVAERTEDKMPVRSTIVGIPILFALEDVDGAPSFLEKALQFVEEHGVKVEGILRQAADVDDVDRRIKEYEQGKPEFSPKEDAHVIADCVKYILRELPSSPVPASSCHALLDACRNERVNRVNAIRAVICETFPEPNRRLLQRVLMMMQTVASHKPENRMSISAVAACMAPLLLRPLLAGDCEIENDFDVGGDGSMQLLQAAAAANHAQAIVITLLEEYDSIFGEDSFSADLYSNTDQSGSETEGATDGEYEDDENDVAIQVYEEYTDDDTENGSDGTCSESVIYLDNDSDGDEPDIKQVPDALSSESKPLDENSAFKVGEKFSSSSREASRSEDSHVNENSSFKSIDTPEKLVSVTPSIEMTTEIKLATSRPSSCIPKSTALYSGPRDSKRLGRRNSGKKDLSMESIDFPVEEEDVEIQKLEATKLELQNRIAEEAKSNAVLQASLERRQKALHERREALRKDVARLHDQLQKEQDKRASLDVGLDMSRNSFSPPGTNITKLEPKDDKLGDRLNQQHAKNTSSSYDSTSSNEPWQTPEGHTKAKDKQKDCEVAVTNVFERSIVKDLKEDPHLDPRGGKENQDSKSSERKYGVQNQQKEDVASNTTISAESSGSASRKSGSRDDGTNSTASAISKLTTRLNFMKERRGHIANELQKLDKNRNQTDLVVDKSSPQENPTSVQNQEKESVSQSKPLAEKSKKSSTGKPNRDLDSTSEAVSQSKPLAEKSKKSSTGKPNQDTDSTSESLDSCIFDGGKSEKKSSEAVEKSSATSRGSHSNFTTRIFSR